MKVIIKTLCALTALVIASCSSTRPVGNVEALERQSPITPDPNVLGNAINGGNAVNYSNGGGGRNIRPLGW